MVRLSPSLKSIPSLGLAGVLGVLGLLSQGCGGANMGGPGGGDDDAAAATTDLEFCAAETNRYRAMVGKPALARSQAIEAYAAEGATQDTASMKAHGHFIATQGGGIAFAENACPAWLGWNLQGTVRATVAACLAAFYSEGPGGGHYENMIGDYGSVGCGWHLTSGGAITIVQDFGQ
jgi:hypothetical protein